MTLQEAIEILAAKRKDDVERNASSSAEACQLGVEALKRHQTLTRHPYFKGLLPLPGETED